MSLSSSSVFFRRQALKTLLGGVSILDVDRLSIHDEHQANGFIRSYGYLWESEEDQKILFSFYRQAVAFLKDQWGEDEGFRIPDELWDPDQIDDLRNLLYFVSSKEEEKKELKIWTCALLKVMHIIAHLQSDLYHEFQGTLRDQILSPIKEKIFNDPARKGERLQGGTSSEKVDLVKFEVKPAKDRGSAIVKLLAKRRLVALNILDRVGVRFIVKNVFDIFRVIRFLVNEGLVSYPHAIANESVNRVYPTSLFLETMDALRSSNPLATEGEVEKALDKKWKESQDKGDLEFLNKDNVFTAPDYRFVKFISRKLVKVGVPGSDHRFRFFYPFEVQIMDYTTYTANQRGPLSHQEYKERQRQAAKLRLFGRHFESGPK